MLISIFMLYVTLGKHYREANFIPYCNPIGPNLQLLSNKYWNKQENYVLHFLSTLKIRMYKYMCIFICLYIDIYFLSSVFFLFSYCFSCSIWFSHESSFLFMLHLAFFFLELAAAVIVSGASFHASASLCVSFDRRAFHMFSGTLVMHNLYSMPDLYFSISMHCQYFTKTGLLLFCTSCT